MLAQLPTTPRHRSPWILTIDGLHHGRAFVLGARSFLGTQKPNRFWTTRYRVDRLLCAFCSWFPASQSPFCAGQPPGQSRQSKKERMIPEKKDPRTLASATASTRRRMIAGSAIALGGLAQGTAGARAAAPQAMTEPKIKEGSTTSESIHEELDFKASPQRIYETLLDSKQVSALSGGAPTEIHRELGGAFSCFDGHIVERIVELMPNRRIVQAWRYVAGGQLFHCQVCAQGTGHRNPISF